MSDFPPGRWRARWIWAPRAATPPSGRVYVAFRREFHGGAVDRMPARVCADSRYVLWCNGREVANGPVRVNPRRRRYDVVDLAPYLEPGPNVLAALVCFYGAPTAWWMPGPTLTSRISGGGFLLEARVGDSWIVTDEQWQAHVLSRWAATAATAGVSGRGDELLDARDLPEDWNLAAHQGESAAANVLVASSLGEPGRPEPPSYPFGPVLARSIGWPEPVDIPLVQTSPGLYDAGAVVAGTLVVDAEGPAGATVAVRAAEFLAESPEEFGVRVTLDGSRRSMESFDAYGLRVARVEAAAGVTVHAVTVRERLAPVTGAAFFECSDPVLEQIWSVGRRTVSLCSFDAYLDCPTREQRAWTGDAVVHQMVDLTTNADWRLARWYPHLAASPRADGMLPMAAAGDAEAAEIAIIPDWALHWVHAVWNLYRYVGDRDEIAALMPVVEGVLRWFEPYLDDDGLLRDVISWVIIDWASVETDGVSAALCGLWARGLLDFAEMADWLGDTGRAGWARTRHATLARAFDALWDPDRERYRDTLTTAAASQHGQSAAIVGGLAPRARWDRLVEVLTAEADLVHATFSVPDREATPNGDFPVGGAYLRQGHPPPWWDVERQVVRAQPFFRYVVHDALAAAGRADLIAAQCRDWAVLLERCPTSWSETWFGGTTSHGWSSTPTRDLMTRVLGVEPAASGFTAARVEPALGDLAWARGAVPCPGGHVHVDVQSDMLTVDCPVPFVHAGTDYQRGAHAIPRGAEGSA